MLDLQPIPNITLLALQQASNPTNLKAKSLKLPSIFSIINGNTSLEMIILLYQYEFKDDNLALLYQDIFKDNNLALLMKYYLQVVVIFGDDNLALL